MLRIARFCFLGVAVMESLLILWDAGKAEVMVTPVYSLEECRIVLVIASMLLACLIALFETNADHP